ncbi:MAG TPA: hypothetical protein VGM75_25385 [Pseudonocardiaceae bacterium]
MDKYDPKTDNPNVVFAPPPPKYATAAQDVAAPTLLLDVFLAPNIPGEDDWMGPKPSDSSSNSSGGPDYAALNPFSFGTGAAETAIQRMLDESGTAVDNYNTLKQKVDSDRDWLFQVQAPQYLSLGSHVSFTDSNGEIVTGDTMNKDLVAAEHGTLRNVADTITLVGQFMGWLNHTAQTYAQADINCVMPIPVPPVGPPLGPVHDDPNPNDWKKHGR